MKGVLFLRYALLIYKMIRIPKIHRRECHGQIYMDKLIGKDFNRPEYRKLMRKIKKNDVLVIKSIDRLGRNHAEILEQWRILTKEKQLTNRFEAVQAQWRNSRISSRKATG